MGGTIPCKTVKEKDLGVTINTNMTCSEQCRIAASQGNHILLFVNRFNKIAIQGTPQMAVDKEAIICLSRVHSYYCKCIFPLFYVYPALTRYLSILFLNILTLLACTPSFGNLFHTLMVL